MVAIPGGEFLMGTSASQRELAHLLNDPEEDIYTLEDGNPIDHQA